MAEIVLTTAYKSNSTISGSSPGDDEEVAIQVYGVTSSDGADDAPGTAVVNTYRVFGVVSNQNIQLRVLPAHASNTVNVKVSWQAIGL